MAKIILFILFLFPITSFGASLVPVMSSSNTPSGIVSCNADSVGQRCWNALDSDLGTYWEPVTTEPWWWKYDFGADVCPIVNEYKITPYSSTLYHMEDWILKGSNDDTNWTNLDTQTSQTSGWTVDVARDYTFTNTTSYRYYKFDISNGNSSDLVIKEFDLLGTSGCSSGEATSTTATTTSEIMALGSIVLGLGIIIALMMIGFTGYIFNRISTKKPWKY